ncbi:hypothetical protein [Serratia marcescens]|uniref:hypothetical protein n=2 Tax=Serratia TaxID=613 RepID=UPI001495A389|nr:hypothetical protein [Serratia marcescens]
MKSFFPSWIIDISTAMTILGFILTVIVFYKVRYIKKSFMNRARLPDIYKNITIKTSSISRLIPDWNNSKNKINEELTTCIALLEVLMTRTPPELKQIIRELLSKLIKKKGFFERKSMIVIENPDMAWEIYRDLSRVSTYLENIVEDLKWE